MNDENYWEYFLKSGRVQDYLTYAGETKQKEEAFKEYPYAGFYYGDGDGDKPDSCR